MSRETGLMQPPPVTSSGAQKAWYWHHADAVFAAEIAQAVERHVCGDWGALDPYDAHINDEAAESGEGQILSAYETSKGRIWIITELAGPDTYTTVLHPDED